MDITSETKTKIQKAGATMSIQKKSLISTLKKANVAREDFAGSAGISKHAAAKSPVAKSPVAKSPVAKSPVAKSPVAKSPVAKNLVTKN
jgi:hypothetical protein